MVGTLAFFDNALQVSSDRISHQKFPQGKDLKRENITAKRRLKKMRDIIN